MEAQQPSLSSQQNKKQVAEKETDELSDEGSWEAISLRGTGGQTKDGESQKEDESKKRTPEEKIPKNPWNRFQQRLKGSGIGGDKKLLSVLYREV